MIMNWWETREPRERNLLIIAAILTAVVGVWFGIVSPIASANADAKREFAAAMEDKALITSALQRLEATGISSSGAAVDFDVFRSKITTLAQQRGLSITRLQAGSDGTLQLFFDNAAPNIVFAWLEEISAYPGGETIRANFTLRGDRVQVTIDLRGAQS